VLLGSGPASSASAIFATGRNVHTDTDSDVHPDHSEPIDDDDNHDHHHENDYDEAEGQVTGADMKDIRHGLGEALGRRLSLEDMAKLVGLKSPDGRGRLTYREWEEGNGPSGPVAVLLSLYIDGIEYDDTGFMRQLIRRRLDGES
jgi:hypothetical protein